MENVLLSMIQNCQLFIDNVHVMYEDRWSNPASPFCFGLTLNYFTLDVRVTN